MTTRQRPLAALPHVMRKELLQLRRDRRMLPMVFVAPVVQLLLLGYAATLDVVDARIAIVDHDHTPGSRLLASTLEAAENASILFVEDSEEAALARIERAQVDLVLVLPPGLGQALAGGPAVPVHLIIDGSDAVSAGLGSAVVASVVQGLGLEVLRSQAAAAGLESTAGIQVLGKVLYNEQLTSRNFMVPAVLALILVIFTSVLTSMAIVREKEVGTLEQLIVAPLSPTVLLLGKLLPFVAIGLVQSTLVVAVATLWFEVPLRGSLALLYALILLFVVNTLAIGLFVSTISRTQQQAMMTVIFFFLMPMMFLSGFVFPIENMPAIIQKLTYVIPLRYFLIIVRGVFLKGVGMDVLWPETLGLAIIGSLLFAGALLRFRKRLD
ncbi:MAG: ABC transporter permease [Pseudomonadota bacterium]